MRQVCRLRRPSRYLLLPYDGGHWLRFAGCRYFFRFWMGAILETHCSANLLEPRSHHHGSAVLRAYSFSRAFVSELVVREHRLRSRQSFFVALEMDLVWVGCSRAFL